MHGIRPGFQPKQIWTYHRGENLWNGQNRTECILFGAPFRRHLACLKQNATSNYLRPSEPGFFVNVSKTTKLKFEKNYLPFSLTHLWSQLPLSSKHSFTSVLKKTREVILIILNCLKRNRPSPSSLHPFFLNIPCFHPLDEAAIFFLHKDIAVLSEPLNSLVGSTKMPAVALTENEE